AAEQLLEGLTASFTDSALVGLAAEDPATRLAVARDLALGLLLEQGGGA
ncbi:MAG: hypothetical protein JHD05_00670, partial [Thermoleophilia bacterium]|nr:hypothetical protein [Thermoleophilia bacterium]